MNCYRWFLAGVTALLLVACNHSSPLALREKAVREIAEGNITAAVVDLKSALAVAPNDKLARWLLTNAFVALEQGKEAEHELNQAVKLGYQSPETVISRTRILLLEGKYEKIVDQEIHDESENPDAFKSLPPTLRAELVALRGTAHVALRQDDQARAAFNKALALNPADAEARIGMAGLEMITGNEKSARAHLKFVFDNTPNHGRAWSALGTLELRLSHFEAAETALTQAIQHKPANTGELLTRGLVRVELKKFTDAKADADLLKKKLPKYFGGYYIEGAAAIGQERYKDAANALEIAANANPDFLTPRFLLAVAQFKLKDFERARASSSSVVARYPGYLPAQRLSAQINLELNDWASAEKSSRLLLHANEKDEQALRMLAETLGQEGKFTEQADLLDRLVALEPKSDIARVALGRSLVLSGHPDRGLAELLSARNLDPDSLQSEIALMEYYAERGQSDKAIEIAKAMREKAPKNPLPINFLGAVARDRNDIRGATAMFEEALSLDPANITANTSLASIAVQIGDNAGARKRYAAILTKQPDELMTMLRIAKLDEIERKPDDMLKALNAAIAAHPDAGRPREVLARYYLLAGKPEQVEAALGEAVIGHSTDPWVLDVLARSQLALNQPAKAAKSVDKLIELAPKVADSYVLRAEALSLMGDIPGAKAGLVKALELDPNHGPAHLALGQLALNNHDLPEARKHISVLEKIAPRSGRVAVLQGDEAKASGNSEKALTLYAHAFSLEPSGQTLILLAAEQWAGGAQDKSFHSLQTWLIDHPEDQPIQATLAGCYLKTGETAKAVAIYEKILAKNENNVLILNNLAMALEGSDPAKGLGYAEKAATIAPKLPAVIDTVSLLQLRLGKVEEAGRQSDQLFSGNTLSLPPAFYFHRALILKAKGDSASAKDMLVKSLSSSPKASFPERAQAEAMLAKLQQTD